MKKRLSIGLWIFSARFSVMSIDMTHHRSKKETLRMVWHWGGMRDEARRAKAKMPPQCGDAVQAANFSFNMCKGLLFPSVRIGFGDALPTSYSALLRCEMSPNRKNTVDHFDGSVPLCRCATASAAELVCVLCRAFATLCQTDIPCLRWYICK